MWHTADKVARLDALQRSSGFGGLRACISSPDAHLQLVYDGVSDPTRFLFGFRLASPGNPGMRRTMQRYSLPQRAFLGPTTMDNELAVIMCNIAQVRPGDFVYDPFCGTCSILITATAMGCYCLGADLDLKILRGKKMKSYVDSYRQYGLQYCDLVWQDINAPALGSPGAIDHIITDPPYQIRASGRTGDDGAKNNDFGANCERCSAAKLYLRLVQTAAKLLRKGGRLVFWLPVPASHAHFDESDVPVCEGMTLLCYPIQVLSSKYGRRLICYEKTSGTCGEAQYMKQELCFENMRKQVGIE